MVKLTGKKINVAVFISGRGSNLKNLINYSKSKYSLIKIKLVISNKINAKGLDFAKKYKIKYFIIKYKNSKISMSISKKKKSDTLEETNKVFLKDLDNMRNVYVKDIRNTLKHLNLNCVGNKKTLGARLKNYYLMIDRCHNNINASV